MGSYLNDVQCGCDWGHAIDIALKLGLKGLLGLHGMWDGLALAVGLALHISAH